MYRRRTTQKRYAKQQRTAGCPFCEVDNPALNPERKVFKETKHATIIANIYPYELWEMVPVEEHLLLVPKRHVGTLTELNAEERADIMNLMCEYETHGYSVYARGVGNVNRSLPHQHTHLIKTNGPKARGSLYLDKPYVLFKF
jgi:diadenosine tetraphosphate (Ap4A) HIT family hydrolase